VNDNEARDLVLQALMDVAPEFDGETLDEDASLRDGADLDSMDFLAFVAALSEAIGADIPEVTTALLNRAFETIQNDSIVLGPAADGGYYLIGLPSRVIARQVSGLFSDMAWGTATVLRETCRRLRPLPWCSLRCR
jgi:glycosyltransferase A (GT-A) superfamily protein (DUF2064 family)